MSEGSQIAGELWTAVLCGFFLLALGHYAYGRYRAFQERQHATAREDRIASAVLTHRNAVIQAMVTHLMLHGTLQRGWYNLHNGALLYAAPGMPHAPEVVHSDDLNADDLPCPSVDSKDDYPRPMGVKGWIKESRFHLNAENDQQAIDALMGKETAPDA